MSPDCGARIASRSQTSTLGRRVEARVLFMFEKPDPMTDPGVPASVGGSSRATTMTRRQRQRSGRAFSIDGHTVEAMTTAQASSAVPSDLAEYWTLQRDDRRREHRDRVGPQRGSAIGRDPACRARGAGKLGARLDVDVPLGSFGVARRQIVAVGRALLREARLIFMDEPTSSLAQHVTRQLPDIVRTLQKGGIGVVFVSHRLAEVLEVSSRVTVLRDGKLVGVYLTRG